MVRCVVEGAEQAEAVSRNKRKEVGQKERRRGEKTPSEKDPVHLLRAHRLPAARALGGLAQGLLYAPVAEGVAAGAAGGLFDRVEADGALRVGE